jgi:hypothetical protein
MAAVPRPWDFGIIYAASATDPLPTYVDIKGVTQSYIQIGSSYVAMTTITSGGVDTSKPYSDFATGLTLSCEFVFAENTEYRLKLQYRRWDETNDSSAWKDLQTVNQNDTSVTKAEQTITGSANTVRLALQTASIFAAGQIRILARREGGSGDAGADKILIRGMVA